MQELDCRGLRCPIPIIKTAQAMSTLAIGEKLRLKSNDPATKPDLMAWARMTGHQVEAFEDEEFIITK